MAIDTKAAKAIFPPTGLVYFWFLNADCAMETLRRHIRAFAKARVGAVVLHPREGLLVPYASDEWFELIRTLVDEMRAAGVQPWLYDEDYCPSGQAGGRIIAEQPQFRSRSIRRFEAPANLKTGELFFFPTGNLLWAGTVGPDGPEQSVDLSRRVGTLRRHWEASDWDSRWYYPATPLYQCPRSGTYLPELAIRKPQMQDGHRLVAFVAMDDGPESPYNGLLDSLNPAATQRFIERIYEGYASALGDRLGTTIPAIFTDEPHMHGDHPWTPDLFDAFARQYGYDLRPRLESLFAYPDSISASRARLDYRLWIGRRFEESWIRPVSQWCQQRGIKLVGHISPEDDPSEQSARVGNLFPTFKHFEFPGLDLIIPAVGDEKHPLINIGVTVATSARQQLGKNDVMSEILGASGLDLTGAEAAKILGWQVMIGVTVPVIHAAFSSTLGLRVLDAPPDCGPDSPRWEAMQEIDRGLKPIIEFTRGAAQTAPVAILWPIRTFNARLSDAFPRTDAHRVGLMALLLGCHQAQVGVHLLDEADLQSAASREGAIRLGNAAYCVLLVHQADVIHRDTLNAIDAATRAGVAVKFCGDAPRWIDDGASLNPFDRALPDSMRAPSQSDWTPWCRQNLPRLSPAEKSTESMLRVTQWSKNGKTHSLMMNLSAAPMAFPTARRTLNLAGGEIIAIADPSGAAEIVHRFATTGVRPNREDAPAPLRFGSWRVRFAGEEWIDLEFPKAVYQLRPLLSKSAPRLKMELTGYAQPDGELVAEWVEYQTTLTPSGATSGAGAKLVLAPTAVRGEVVVGVAGKEQASLKIVDTDTSEREVDLSGVIRDETPVVFRFNRPMALDGFKLPPKIRS